MKEELFARIDALALKMGVAAEHLWEVLVRQGYIEGAYGVGMLVGGAVGFYLSYRLMRWGIEYEHKSGIYDMDDEGAVAAVAAGFLMLGCVILFIAGLGPTQYLFNPEYFALKAVTKMLP